MGLLFRKRSKYRGTVYFPYTGEYRISKEAAQWMADHVVSSDIDYSLESHITIYYLSDGTPPPTPQPGDDN
jgi:hypothetical protein